MTEGTHVTPKLGKAPARPEAVKLKLANYINTTQFPTPPASFGHESLIQSWGMLGNDQYGDCVWAGAAHETLMWNAEAHHPVTFTSQSVLSDYSAVTGFNPNDPNTDQGTDMQKAASYRKKTGVKDAIGRRHQVGAYLAITPGNVQEHLLALYLFGAVGIGIEFPDTAMRQFNYAKPWDVVPGAKIQGGHYIPLVARRNNMLVCVTWGRTQPMTDAFFSKYNDESIVYISNEMLVNGKSPEGFNVQQLQADLAQLH
jgi:hypothetical protein